MTIQVIDATDLVLGRMATTIAKKIIEGEEVAVVNAESAVISGKKKMIIDKYKKAYAAGSKYNGPFWPKRPDLFVKRSVRGMIPWKKASGKEAFKRLKVYIGVPDAYKEVEAMVCETAKASDLGTLNRIKVGVLCKQLGWSG